MTPYFFGDPKRPLYATYHAPRPSAALDAAVLLCPSIAHEHAASRAALSALARRLAADGRHVLGFDYTGVGESAGEIGRGQFLRWLRDIDLAIAELSALSGARALTVVGVSVGALLAAMAFATVRAPLQQLVLWDPVIRGADFMAALERRHRQQLGRRRLAPDSQDDLLGYRFPADLRRNLAFADLRAGLEFAAGMRISVVAPDESVLVRELGESLRARQVPVTITRASATPVDAVATALAAQ
ncbi:MAG: alpha/beta fold hydrolase [Proteobacteria bacterium]|nr:alpha/beta fold hydrolase [Pseudomonadota bacterium]